MIHIIKGHDRSKHADLISDMFELRHQIFIQIRRWSLPTKGNSEIDQYDVDDAVYFIDVDHEGRIAGSVRITPTDRYSLLADYFPHLASEVPAPRSSTVYEATRYIVQPALKSPDQNRRAKARLIGSVLHWCLRNDVGRLQTVIDIETLSSFVEMSPQVMPMGLSKAYGGGRGVIGGGECIAITVPATEQVLADVIAYGNLSEADLATELAA